MKPIELNGPEGSNPLGFLCALGVLRALSNAWPEAEVKMSWQQTGAAWRPLLCADQPDLNGKDEEEAKEAIVNALYVELKKMNGHPALVEQFKSKDEQEAWKQWKDTTKIPATEFCEYADRIQKSASSIDRQWVDFVAAIGCEAIRQKGKDKSTYISDTDLRTINGAGRQSFFPTLRDLASSVGESHLQEAIFGKWQYKDEGLGFRWDPMDIRQHAYQWGDPSSESVKSVWGANLLAVEGMLLFPTMPSGMRLQTTGFSQTQPRTRNEKVFFTWPIWQEAFVSQDVVRSVLAFEELQKDKPDRLKLAKYGVAEIFRSERIVFDKYQRRNFTPAQPV